MGTQDSDRIDFETPGAGTTDKAVFDIDTRIASPNDEEFDKGYVDPKEERAFVSRPIRFCK